MPVRTLPCEALTVGIERTARVGHSFSFAQRGSRALSGRGAPHRQHATAQLAGRDHPRNGFGHEPNSSESLPGMLTHARWSRAIRTRWHARPVIGRATLRAERAELALSVEAFVPARGELESTLSVTVEHGSYRFAASCLAFVPPPDLASFLAELESLSRQLSGTATLCRNPDYFHVAIEMREGKGTMSGVVFATATTMLRFDAVPLDQTNLDEPIREFRELLVAVSKAVASASDSRTDG
jgi:hypothetical protein